MCIVLMIWQWENAVNSHSTWAYVLLQKGRFQQNTTSIFDSLIKVMYHGFSFRINWKYHTSRNKNFTKRLVFIWNNFAKCKQPCCWFFVYVCKWMDILMPFARDGTRDGRRCLTCVPRPRSVSVDRAESVCTHKHSLFHTANWESLKAGHRVWSSDCIVTTRREKRFVCIRRWRSMVLMK